MPRLESALPTRAEIPGVRVVIDARPMQEPERSPLTADYLDHLLKAFAREPLLGESFVVISRTLRDDPTDTLEDEGLPVVARRRVPPTTRVFRSAGMTLDSFLLRGAEIGAAADVDGEAPEHAVFHTAGGAVPVASGLPIVATLLDLAPWELPGIYASSAAARFGHRLRARVLHDAARVIVCSRASAETARRRLHLPQERLAVVPLAVDESFRAAGQQPDAVAETRERLGLPVRYLAFAGRYDARKDMRTLFEALKQVRDRYASGQDRGSRSRRGAAPTEGQPTPPPTIVFALTVGAPDEADVVARQIASNGMNELVRLVVPADAPERARILAGAEAFVYPALSEATALPSSRGTEPGRAGHLHARRCATRGCWQRGDRGRAARRQPTRRGAGGNLGRRLIGRATAQAGTPEGRNR